MAGTKIGNIGRPVVRLFLIRTKLQTRIAFRFGALSSSLTPLREGNATSAPQVHAAGPAEVKIVSMPTLPPPEVRVTVPQDDSTRNLVIVTWALFIANVVLCAATVWVGLKQSWDTRRRDRDAMLREVSRTAHKVLAEATRVEQLAEQVPRARIEMHALAGRGIPNELKAEIEATKNVRIKELQKMVRDTMPLVPALPNTASPLPRYQAESGTLRARNTAMEAAAVAGTASRP